MPSRRNFLRNVGLASTALAVGGVSESKANSLIAKRMEKGPAIQKITVFTSGGSFYRFIGMNAYDKKPKGIMGSRRTVLIELSDGTMGIGTHGYRPITDEVVRTIKALIGKDIFSLYQWDAEKITGVEKSMEKYFYDANYAWVESAILDALGKLKNLPVWQLMGTSVRHGIDPYDGTLYFEDIANNTDARIIGTIGKQIKHDGYRAIKIKLGRPDKWLPGEAGVERDVEAFIALREAVGSNFNIMADANNGYRDKFDWAVKLMKKCAPYDMYFMEELFPDNAAQYLKLRDILLEENTFIPIGEGESIQNMDTFSSYFEAGVYNYVQPDMPTCGFSNIMRAAKAAEKYNHVKLIPHVWQSQMGLLMSLHASKIQSNIPFVEDSRYMEHALMANNYLFDDGKWFIPDAPGWGVTLSPNYKQFIEGEPLIIT